MAKLTGSIKPWASAANHVVGDYPGEPTKVDGGLGVIAAGFIPGDIFAPTAEETNFELNRYSLVLQWVQDGSATADISAHIVETNSAGGINVRRGTFETGDAFMPAVQGTASGGGPGVWGIGTIGDGLLGQSNGATGYGARGVGSTNAGGVRGIGAGSGRGGYFTGGATAPAALQADATGGSPGFTANGAGGEPDIFLNPTDNYGFDIQCAAGALGGGRILANGQPGLYISQDDPDGNAIVLLGDSAANTGVATLHSQAGGAGNAANLQASSGTGYCLRLVPKINAPSKGAISFGSQTARPSAVDSGQLTYLSAEAQFAHSQFNDFGEPGPGVGWRGIWSSTGGFALAYTTKNTYYGIGAVQEVVCTMTANAGNAPKLAGRTVRMRLVMSPSVTPINTAATMNFIVRDTTSNIDRITRSGAGTGPTSGVYLQPAPSTGWRPSHGITFEVDVPASGTRSWQVKVWVTGVGVTLDLHDVSLEFEGLT